MVSLLLSWGSGVGIMVNPSSAHMISALLFPAAKVLSLGFGFGLVRVLGKQRVVEWKPCLEHVL